MSEMYQSLCGEKKKSNQSADENKKGIAEKGNCKVYHIHLFNSSSHTEYVAFSLL